VHCRSHLTRIEVYCRSFLASLYVDVYCRSLFPAGGPFLLSLYVSLCILSRACLAPRVYVWGVWFGFGLRCVALLCGVFVRLHLTLFPAGGAFRPSLSVNLYSRGRSGSLALPFAGATRPCVGRARTSRRVPLAGPRCAVSPDPRRGLFRPVSRPVCGFGCLVRLRFALRSLAVWRVCAIAPSFVSGWRALSSVSQFKYIVGQVLQAPWGPSPDAAWGPGCPSGAGWRASLSRAALILGVLRELSVAHSLGIVSLFVGRASRREHMACAGPRCAVLPGPRLN
jgi:hypothetical protein